MVWEQMPLFEGRISQDTYAVDWLMGDGTADPALDTLVMFHGYGVFRYAPGEANGEWGAWRRLCIAGCATEDGLVTSEGTIVYVSSTRRSTDRGRTWEEVAPGLPRIIEVTLPWMREASGGRAVLLSASGYIYEHVISYADGEAGSWRVTGPASFFPEGLGEVPPSPALPRGRLLSNGERVMYSDDGSETWQMAALGNQPEEAYRRFHFTFLPVAGHPYGGIAFGTGCEYVQCDSGGFGTGETVDLYRSDDGGATWSFVHHFTAEETGVPVLSNIGPQVGVPFAGPDGALWAGISRANGGKNPGVIMRSTDHGVTWHRADAGFTGYTGPFVPTPLDIGWRVHQLAVARDGRMYAATDQGVWRTVQPVVTAAEANPRPVDLAVRVAPNPSSAEVTVTADVAAPASYVLVDVFDLEGRDLGVHHADALSAGEHAFRVDVSGWASGVYVARVWSGGQQQSTRFTVAR